MSYQDAKDVVQGVVRKIKTSFGEYEIKPVIPVMAMLDYANFLSQMENKSKVPLTDYEGITTVMDFIESCLPEAEQLVFRKDAKVSLGYTEMILLAQRLYVRGYDLPSTPVSDFQSGQSDTGTESKPICDQLKEELGIA